MKRKICLYLLTLIGVTPVVHAQTTPDWLIDPRPFKAVVKQTDSSLVLTNGLLSRSFRTIGNVVCTDYRNLRTNEQLLRAIKPEARLTINGKDYNVGGLYGQPQQAYLLPEWVNNMKTGKEDFRYTSHRINDITPYINWQPQGWSGKRAPAPGKELVFTYKAGAPALNNWEVEVHYAVYDGIPLLSKWLTVKNGSATPGTLDQVIHEIIAVVEEEAAVVGKVDQMKPPHGLYIESNYAFNNSMKASLSDQTTHWKADSTYTAQVNYDLQTPCLLEVHPKVPVGKELPADATFTSIRTFELLLDGYDRERNGLAQRKMYRTIAPWTTQNPIFMHLISTDPQKVKVAIDQCVDTGYEGVILSFGSGLNMEDTTAANIARYKALADYAHSKHILLGGYSLFSSRRISDEDDVINPATGKPGGAFFGNAPCLGSRWGLAYLQKIEHFIAQTGFDIFENDGPYPGDVCASDKHPGHTGVKDAQWKQMELQKGLYHRLNEKGVYINAPDWYFLDGTHKIGLGYREVNFSLPREQQVILNRQNIYDGTWEKTPGMSWGFVPLTQYQGGGAAATLEPLKDHLHAYEQLMMQYYGAGIQACYRGPRLYDTDSTKALVKKVITWYKQYRAILNEDIIHLRRADGRDWDGIMHVSSGLKERGLAMLYNPLTVDITREIQLPLYYTGLTGTAAVSVNGAAARRYQIDRNNNISIRVRIPANSYTWLLIQ